MVELLNTQKDEINFENDNLIQNEEIQEEIPQVSLVSHIVGYNVRITAMNDSSMVVESEDGSFTGLENILNGREAILIIK